MSIYEDMVSDATGPMDDEVHGDDIEYLPESGGVLKFKAVIDADPFPDTRRRDNASDRKRQPKVDCVISFARSKLPEVVEQVDHARLPGRLIRKPDGMVKLRVSTILSDPGDGKWILGLVA